MIEIYADRGSVRILDNGEAVEPTRIESSLALRLLEIREVLANSIGVAEHAASKCILQSETRQIELEIAQRIRLILRKLDLSDEISAHRISRTLDAPQSRPTIRVDPENSEQKSNGVEPCE
jgi:hypothetical protein